MGDIGVKIEKIEYNPDIKISFSAVTFCCGRRILSLLGLNSILGMEGYLEVDGEKLSKADIKKMLAMDEGLSLIKGKWVEVDHERLNALLQAAEKFHDDITMLEALRLGLNDGSKASADSITDEIDINAVSNSSWISELLRDLRSTSGSDSIQALPPTFLLQSIKQRRKNI